jgi:3-hydroxyisobutyrate dehydrogenase-like beta-hydroxyacid dehydrogenase
MEASYRRRCSDGHRRPQRGRCSSLLFAAIGQRVFCVGDTPSAANLVKLSGNFMIMAAIESMAEAMTLAEKGGVDRAMLLEVLTGTLFGAPVYKTYGEILVEDRFTPAGFAAPLGLKDMNLVDAAAGTLRTPMPVLGVVRDHLRAAIAQDGPDVDWAAIGLVARRSAGL